MSGPPFLVPPPVHSVLATLRVGLIVDGRVLGLGGEPVAGFPSLVSLAAQLRGGPFANLCPSPYARSAFEVEPVLWDTPMVIVFQDPFTLLGAALLNEPRRAWLESMQERVEYVSAGLLDAATVNSAEIKLGHVSTERAEGMLSPTFCTKIEAALLTGGPRPPHPLASACQMTAL